MNGRQPSGSESGRSVACTEGEKRMSKIRIQCTIYIADLSLTSDSNSRVVNSQPCIRTRISHYVGAKVRKYCKEHDEQLYELGDYLRFTEVWDLKSKGRLLRCALSLFDNYFTKVALPSPDLDVGVQMQISRSHNS